MPKYVDPRTVTQMIDIFITQYKGQTFSNSTDALNYLNTHLLMFAHDIQTLMLEKNNLTSPTPHNHTPTAQCQQCVDAIIGNKTNQ